MLNPIIRNLFEMKDLGEGYILFGKVSGVPEREAEVSESNVIKLQKGESSNLGLHPDEEEIYYYFRGEGTVTLDGVEYPVRPGSVAFIPRNCSHITKNLGDEELCYTCVAIYFDEFEKFFK